MHEPTSYSGSPQNNYYLPLLYLLVSTRVKADLKLCSRTDGCQFGRAIEDDDDMGPV